MPIIRKATTPMSKEKNIVPTGSGCGALEATSAITGMSGIKSRKRNAGFIIIPPKS